MRNFTLNSTLTMNEFYILLALTQHTLHGYGVRSQVAVDSDSTLILAPGTIYATLTRLVAKGLVERVPADGRDNIAARYRLTAMGRRQLEREIRRLERVVTQAHCKLGRKLGAGV